MVCCVCNIPVGIAEQRRHFSTRLPCTWGPADMLLASMVTTVRVSVSTVDPSFLVKAARLLFSQIAAVARLAAYLPAISSGTKPKLLSVGISSSGTRVHCHHYRNYTNVMFRKTGTGSLVLPTKSGDDRLQVSSLC